MATVRDKRIINQTIRSAKSLGVAASWVKSGRPINLAHDFLFELYILFELILNVKNHNKVIYISGTGGKKDQFPRKPANKKGRPRFHICNKSDGIILWQICAGTRIKDIHNKNRSPDISFQFASASETPSYRDVKLIWDAKYRNDNSNRITHSELAKFAHFIELLDLRGKKKPGIPFTNFKKLRANCLITNGRESTEPDAELSRLDMKEVYSFYPGKSFAVRP